MKNKNKNKKNIYTGVQKIGVTWNATLNKMESKGGPSGRTDNKISYNITKDIK
jgi:hypothetical protein